VSTGRHAVNGGRPAARRHPGPAEVDYLRQLYYRVGERLCVRSWITRIGTKSITMRQELIQDDQAAISLDAICVVFDYASDATRVLTEEERTFRGRYLAR
jgi:acyl-CoA thioester hydrolase